MHQVNVVAVAAVVTVGFLAGFVIPASPQSVTAFEGARLIVGDGHGIEHATLVVEDARIAQAGQTADVRVPAGAMRFEPLAHYRIGHKPTYRSILIDSSHESAYTGLVSYRWSDVTHRCLGTCTRPQARRSPPAGRREPMAHYLFQGGYVQEAWVGLVKTPEAGFPGVAVWTSSALSCTCGFRECPEVIIQQGNIV